jgi:hypothetical protein
LYIHVHAHGDPVAIATAIHAALTESKTPFGASAAPAASTAPIDLDTDTLDAAIRTKGKVNGSVYQLSVPPGDGDSTGHGISCQCRQAMAIPRAMGTAIAINFQPTGGIKGGNNR